MVRMLSTPIPQDTTILPIEYMASKIIPQDTTILPIEYTPSIATLQETLTQRLGNGLSTRTLLVLIELP